MKRDYSKLLVMMTLIAACYTGWLLYQERRRKWELAQLEQKATQEAKANRDIKIETV
jgi:type VI protein secretion system component VasK